MIQNARKALTQPEALAREAHARTRLSDKLTAAQRLDCAALAIGYTCMAVFALGTLLTAAVVLHEALS